MTLILVFVFSMNAFASNLEIGGKSFIATNLTESSSGVNFNLINKDISINYDIQQLDTDTVKVNTVVKMSDGLLKNTLVFIISKAPFLYLMGRKYT